MVVALPGVDEATVLVVSSLGVGGAKALVVVDAVGDVCGHEEVAARSLGLECMAVGSRMCLWRLWPREQSSPAGNPETYLSRCSQGPDLITFFIIIQNSIQSKIFWRPTVVLILERIYNNKQRAQ